MTNEEIKELLEIFNSSDVAEMEVQRGDNRLRLRRVSSMQDVSVPVQHFSHGPVLQALAAPAPAPAPVAAGNTAPTKPESNETLVKSPIVGTFYECPAPGAPPFVKVGDHIEPGQVLCIIESMKLMNEIEAEIGGTVVARLVENGRPVEYGEALFSIRPR
jgi:acetyl-CoA carboxylase biotin carboxyl carrier protein